MSEATTGQILKEARKARGFTLEQVASETHIRLHFLEALESDDIRALPSLVQGRGFLRLYAETLGLDPLPLLSRFGTPGEVASPAPAPTTPPPSPQTTTIPASLPQAVETTKAPEPPAVGPEPDLNKTFQATDAGETPNVPRSQRIYREIGEKLRAQRELLSLPMADVESYIHVRSRYLEALEDGRMDDLPSPVQGRGMLANYARFLNLDAEAILLRFAEALQARREELAPPIPEEKRRPPVVVARHPALKRFLSVDLFLASGLVALLVLFIVWGTRQVFDLKGKRTPTTNAPNISDVLLASPATTPQGSPTVAGSATIPSGAATTEEPTELADVSVAPQATATLAVTLPAGTGGTIKIGVIASQRVWMQVTVDGQVKFSGRTLPGGSYTFDGDQQIELLTGNGAGLQVFFNQNDMGVLGSIGQVVDIVYTPNGVIVPTASPTSTPTKSPAVTGTPSTTGSRTPVSPTATPGSGH